MLTEDSEEFTIAGFLFHDLVANDASMTRPVSQFGSHDAQWKEGRKEGRKEGAHEWTLY
jgi:hypothetical protein